MFPLNWRHVYLGTIGLRLVLGLGDSYIHPDEHFQSFEVLTASIFNYTTSPPWEFASTLPARSFGPLYLFYGPLLYFIRFTGIVSTPIHIWYLVRLQNVLLGWVFTDMCIHRMLPTKPERIKGIFFTLTSYATLVFQSHTFSNSIETILVLFCVYVVDELRFVVELKEPRLLEKPQKFRLWWFGVCVAVGVFNRITFPAFLILPVWFLMRYFAAKPADLIYAASGFIIASVGLILTDTILFKTPFESILSQPLNWSNYVVTPLNNLLYNSNYDNLALHGIHPYYNHLLVNLPQLLGPGLVFLLFKNKYWKTTPFVSLVSGVLFLSLVPHQELRFLLPVVPLACCCFDLVGDEPLENEKKQKKTSYLSLLINLWYLFNIALSILMGIYHQGGVVPALNHLRESHLEEPALQIWWRTYSPPTWLLGDQNNSTQIITLNDADFKLTINASKHVQVVDTMGLEPEKVLSVVLEAKKTEKKVYLIAPVASFNVALHETIGSYNKTWSYSSHLDLDHLDFSDMKSLQPGLAIYELL